MCMKKDKKAKKVKIDYTEIYRKRILCILKQSGSKPVPFRTLYAKCKGKKDRPDMFKQALRNLEGEGAIFEKKGGFVVSMTEGVFPATVSRVNKTFGFIRRNDDNTEVFVPGKFLMGAMPNDVVLARLIPARGEKPEGEVVRIVEENFSQFSGTVISEGARMLVSPDSLTKEPLEIVGSECDYQEGDKVLAEVCRRGQRHSEHKVRVIMKFGSSDDASSSAKAVLMLAGVETEFPSEVIDEAKHAENIGIPDGEIEKRLDLRDLPIFTIDGADTKDIDDADPTEAARRKFVLTPWDLDTSLGGNHNGAYSDGNYTSWHVADAVKNGGFYPFGFCQSQTDYQQMLRNRWVELRKGALSVENVCKVMDGYRDLFLNTGAWKRMVDHFNAQKSKPKHVADLAKEVNLVEQWYKTRFAEMDAYFGTTPSGIKNVETWSGENAVIYDLQGRKVTQPQQHGIYIKNGKKICF